MQETIIHPTAIVEKGVELGQGVSIGPFCYVEAGAVIGDNCELMSHVVATGGVRLGAGGKVYPHAILGCDPQNGKHKGGPTTLNIGVNCLIREGVTMHRGSDSSRGYTSIGDNCQFLAYAHVAHDCDVGDHVTFANNVMVGGHTIIGHHAILGGGAAVHQFVRVGHHAFVGGMAALAHDLIPYGSAVGVHAYLGGLNIIGMKRSGMKRQEIHQLRHAVKMLFDRSKPVRERAEDVMQAFPESASVVDLIDFISVSTKRAYCTPPLNRGSAGIMDSGND